MSCLYIHSTQVAGAPHLTLTNTHTNRSTHIRRLLKLAIDRMHFAIRLGLWRSLDWLRRLVGPSWRRPRPETNPHCYARATLRSGPRGTATKDAGRLDPAHLFAEQRRTGRGEGKGRGTEVDWRAKLESTDKGCGEGGEKRTGAALQLLCCWRPPLACGRKLVCLIVYHMIPLPLPQPPRRHHPPPAFPRPSHRLQLVSPAPVKSMPTNFMSIRHSSQHAHT